MAVDNRKTIDAIGIDRNSGHVILTIFDEKDWTNTYEHLYFIQEKLNSYLSYIESGEVYTSYPKADGKDFEFSIVFKYDLTRDAIEFLDKFQKIVENAGFSLAWEVAK